MLWSDPTDEKTILNFKESSREAGVLFGYNACKKFCYENDLTHIFRGH